MLRSLVTLAALAAATAVSAATIETNVRDARGRAVAEAVVYAIPEGREVPAPHTTAVMDQKNRTFVPHVLAIQTGTSVEFPNSDDVRHQVYSFSPAKTFQLPLYKGKPASPVVFDKAGVVALGCNIHDSMNAYIVVVDTPYFGTTAKTGDVTLANVPSGRYTVHVWYADMRSEPPSVTVNVSGNEREEVKFVAR